MISEGLGKEAKQQYYLNKAQELGKIGTWELDVPKNKLVWTDESYRIFGIPIGPFSCRHSLCSQRNRKKISNKKSICSSRSQGPG